MAKKKNLGNTLTAEEEYYINEKMKNGFDDRYNTPYINCNKALNYKLNVKCKNQKQKEYYKLIKDKEVVFCSGSAGSGKSYLALGAALELLKDPNTPFNKILVVVQPLQSEIEIGFLKGDLTQKLEPYIMAHSYTMEKILAHSGNINPKEILSNLRKCNMLEFGCISFLRGFTIDNTIVICEESQGLPKSGFKTLLTRIGENSKYIFNGDFEQCDNKEIRKNKDMEGLKYVINKFKETPEIGTCEFGLEDIVRNPLIGKILEKWD
jgi:phosphate starvation-inducible PhoH-like protein